MPKAYQRSFRCVNLEEKEIAWMAGFFDGEGSVSILHTGLGERTYILVAGITVITDGILERFKDSFGGILHKYKASNRGHSDYWQWRVRSKFAVIFLDTILPYLKIKQGEAKLGIEFWSEYSWKRWREHPPEHQLIAEHYQDLLTSSSQARRRRWQKLTSRQKK